MLLLCQCYF